MTRRQRLEAPNHTQTPNALFDHYLPEIKSAAELKVTLVIVRKTFGWHVGEEELSYNDLVRLTGLSRQSVIDGVKAGIERGTIRRRQVGEGFMYSLVLDGQLALVGGQESRPGGSRNLTPGWSKSSTSSGQESGPPTGQESGPPYKETGKQTKETPHVTSPQRGEALDKLWSEKVAAAVAAEQVSEITAATWLRPDREGAFVRLVELVDGDRAVFEASEDCATWLQMRFAPTIAKLLEVERVELPGARAVRDAEPVALEPRRRRRRRG